MAEQTLPVTFLETEKIKLCPMRKEDLNIYLKWLNNGTMVNYLMTHFPVSKDAEEATLDKMLTADPSDSVNLGIWLKEPETLIGNLGLLKIDNLHRHAMIGIFIGDEENWGKGYGTEAMSLIMEYGFKTLNLRKIWLGYMGHNDRGRAAYDKLGFREIGRYREHRFINGKYEDEVLMEIFKDEFLKD